MKQLISFLALSFCALAVNAQATHNMKISFQDGNTVVYGIENVKTVEFVEKEEPSAKETYTIAGAEYPMPEAVDLGLPSGTKWASMNIGAKDDNDPGGYYGWADPTGELDVFSLSWRNETLDGAWNTDLFGGINPPIDISGTELDIATQNMGKLWCLPSANDFQELTDNCSFYIYPTYVKVVGLNGAFIKLPNSGIKTWSDTNYQEVRITMSEFPCLWASTYISPDPEEESYNTTYNHPSADYACAELNGFRGLFGPCYRWYRYGLIPARAIRKNQGN